MSPNDDVTLGEIARRIDRTDEEMRLGFTTLRKQIEAIDFISRPEFLLSGDALRERVGDLESTNMWIIRTVGAVLIMAVLAAMIAV